jgi:hypothetical protein
MTSSDETPWTTEERLRAQLMAEEIKGLRGRGPITVEVDQFAAFQLIGALQLAWRHPGLSVEQCNTIEQFGRGLQRAYEGPDTPQLALTLEQGWNREFDR